MEEYAEAKAGKEISKLVWRRLKAIFGGRKARIGKTATKVILPGGVEIWRVTEIMEVPLSEKIATFANDGVKRILTLPGVAEIVQKPEGELGRPEEKAILEVHRFVGKGDGKLELWDSAGAEEAYREAYNTSVVSGDKFLQSLCLCLLAGAVSMQGRFGEGLPLVERALEIKPDDAWALGIKGFILLGLEQYERALACFDRLLELRPDHAEAWRMKGWTLSSLKRHNEALPALERALELKPKDLDTLISKGLVLLVLKRYDEALRCFEELLALKPDHLGAWLGKGYVLMGLEQYENALPALERTLQLNPQIAMAWQCKGVVLEGLMRYEEAILSYERAAEVKRDYADAWYGRGRLLALLGRYEQALPCLEEATRLNPNDGKAWYIKGMVLGVLERYDQAKESLERAMPLREQHPDKGAMVFSLLTQLTLMQGLASIIAEDMKEVDERALELIQLTKEAEKDGMAQVVEKAVAEFKAKLSKKELKLFDEFEQMIEEVKSHD